MLIVDINTLCAVSVLNFRDDVFLNRLGALRFKYILRIFGAWNKQVARGNRIAVVYKYP